MIPYRSNLTANQANLHFQTRQQLSLQFRAYKKFQATEPKQQLQARTQRALKCFQVHHVRLKLNQLKTSAFQNMSVVHTAAWGKPIRLSLAAI